MAEIEASTSFPLSHSVIPTLTLCHSREGGNLLRLGMMLPTTTVVVGDPGLRRHSALPKCNNDSDSTLESLLKSLSCDSEDDDESSEFEKALCIVRSRGLSHIGRSVVKLATQLVLLHPFLHRCCHPEKSASIQTRQVLL